MVTKDVIPFGMVYGERAKLMGFNLVGLRRLGVGNKHIKELKGVYETIFCQNKTLQKRILDINTMNNPLIQKVLDFIKAEKDRAILNPYNN